MEVRAQLLEDSTETRAVLLSENAAYQATHISFTVTPETGDGSPSYITCDGITSVANAKVSKTAFNDYLRGRRPPHSVILSWTGYGIDMGEVHISE